jgi:hypothetical protein
VRSAWSRWSVGAVVAALAVHAASSVARADALSDARDLFARGRELRLRGDCANASGLFRQAYAIYPSGLGSVRNLAECEESLGHFASSSGAWLELRRALRTIDDQKYAGWDKDAEAAVARLEPKLATLTIDLDVVSPNGEATTAEGIDIVVDGEVLPRTSARPTGGRERTQTPTSASAPLEVDPRLRSGPLCSSVRDPGRHTILARGAGVAGRAERTVDLAPGDSKRVTLRVVVAPGAARSKRPDPNEDASVDRAPAAAQGVVSDPREDDARRTDAALRIIGWSAIGVGAASLVGAAVAVGVRQSALDSVNASCPSYAHCDPSLQATANRGAVAGTTATALGILSGVGLAGGVALLVFAPPRSRLALTVGLGSASVGGGF